MSAFDVKQNFGVHPCAKISKDIAINVCFVLAITICGFQNVMSVFLPFCNNLGQSFLPVHKQTPAIKAKNITIGNNLSLHTD